MRLHEKDPERSARSIAKETGLSDKTVTKAVVSSKPMVEPKKSNGLNGGGEIPQSTEKTTAKKSGGGNGRGVTALAPSLDRAWLRVLRAPHSAISPWLALFGSHPARDRRPGGLYEIGRAYRY